jgi:VWFA-related protein
MKKRKCGLVFAAALLALPVPVLAQEKNPEPALKREVNLILMDVCVRDAKGKLLTELEKEDFQLTEDGAEKPTQYFSEDELPLAVALVLDRSGSMAPSFGELRQSVAKALGALRPDDRVVLFSFTRKAQRLTDLTADREQIAAAIATVKPGGGTDILDTLYTVGNYLKQEAPKERKAIILISDNIAPRHEKHSQHDVIEAAIEHETDIHSLCACEGAACAIFRGMMFVPYSVVDMKKVAEETGGGVIKTAKDDRLIQALSETLLRLRKRYAIGYYAPQLNEPGKFHKVKITLTSAHGAQNTDYFISARRGFYEPKKPAKLAVEPQVAPSK